MQKAFLTIRTMILRFPWFLWSMFFLCTVFVSIKKSLYIVTQDGLLNEFASVFITGADIIGCIGILVYILENKRYILSSIYTRTRYVPRGTYLLVALCMGVTVFSTINAALPLSALLGIIHKIVILAGFVLIFIKIVPRGTIYRRALLQIIAGIGFLQSVTAIIQFFLQKSIGLKFLGESIFDPYMHGVAKTVYLGEVIVRPYGLTPHPNILAGLLVMTIISTIILFIDIVPRGTWAMKFHEALVPRGTSAIFLLIITFQITALLMTFSRSAFIGIFIALLFLFLQQIFVKILFHVEQYNDRMKILFHVEQYASIFATFSVFFVFCVSCAYIVFMYTVDSHDLFFRSTNERLFYTNAAIVAIKNHAIAGVGVNNFAYVVDNFVEENIFFPWQHQPVHNVFLLIAAENGIFVLLCFIFVLWKTFQYLFVRIVPRGTIFVRGHKLNGLFHVEHWSIVMLLVVILCVIATSDHYLWDIQQGLGIVGMCGILLHPQWNLTNRENIA